MHFPGNMRSLYCGISLGLGLLVGCGPAPVAEVPQFNAASAAAKALELFDTNKDGKLEGAELEKAPGLKFAIPRIDSNQDKAISQDELASRISTYVKDGVAVQPVSLNLKYEGKPLADAVVTLVPETFLTPPLKPATATSDFNGSASPKVEGLSLVAVFLGLYRVEITGKTPQGQPLPAKFNTETTLGLEVALDVPEFERGITFDLTAR